MKKVFQVGTALLFVCLCAQSSFAQRRIMPEEMKGDTLSLKISAEIAKKALSDGYRDYFPSHQCTCPSLNKEFLKQIEGAYQPPKPPNKPHRIEKARLY